MMDPLWSDEQIAAWASTHDRLTWRDSPSGGGFESVIPTAAVTALLRDLRDETAQRMAELEDKVRACSEKYSAEWHNAAALEAQVVALEAQLAEARTRWPTGDEAVKQLAEAANDVQWDYLSHSQPIEVWRVFLAAVLQRLAKGGSHADAD